MKVGILKALAGASLGHVVCLSLQENSLKYQICMRLERWCANMAAQVRS